MDGLSRQMHLLHAAWQALDPCRHSLADEIVADLHLTLSRATALMHCGVSIHQQQEKRNASSGSCSHARSFEHGAPPQRQTLRTISDRFRVSVAQLRRWNPQLPEALRDDEVLPPDTYLKLLSAATSPSNGSPASLVQPPGFPAARGDAVAVAAIISEPMSTAGKSPQPHGASNRAAVEMPHSSAESGRRQIPGSCCGNSGRSRSSRVGESSGGLTATSMASGSARGHPRYSDGGASQGRCSGWTEGSTRSSSFSPLMQEPSMTNSFASAAPPACAPPPVVSTASFFPHDSLEVDQIDDTPVYVDAAVVLLPSHEVVAPAKETTPGGGQRSKTSSPSPAVKLFGPAPPPPRPFAGTSAMSSPDIDSRHNVIDGGESSASGASRAIRTRHGRSPSPQHSLASDASTPLNLSPARRIDQDVRSVTLLTNTQTSPTLSQPSPLNDESFEAELAISESKQQREAAVSSCRSGSAHGREPVSRSGARGPSRSLSAVSPPSSLEDEGEGYSRYSHHQAGAKRGDGDRAETLRRGEMPTPTRRPTSVSSPSVEAISMPSSCSPSQRRQRASPSPPAAITGPQKAVVVSTTPEESSAYLTPDQQRGRRLGHPEPRAVNCPHGAALENPLPPPSRALDPSARPTSPSADGRARTKLSASETPSSYTGSGDAEEEEEDLGEDLESTPFARPPLMLGRNVCSSPPTLGRPLDKSRNRAETTTAAPAALGVAASSTATSAPPATALPIHQQLGKEFSAPASTAVPSRQTRPNDRAPRHSSASTGTSPLHELPPRREDSDCVPAEGPRAQETEEDEFDTLEGIAAAYHLTVDLIKEWNPYLAAYRPEEPLPPDLPIVLPMSEEDDTDVGDDASVVTEERENQVLRGTRLDQLPSSFRDGSCNRKSQSLSAFLENSPVPLPPL